MNIHHKIHKRRRLWILWCIVCEITETNTNVKQFASGIKNFNFGVLPMHRCASALYTKELLKKLGCSNSHMFFFLVMTKRRTLTTSNEFSYRAYANIYEIFIIHISSWEKMLFTPNQNFTNMELFSSFSLQRGSMQSGARQPRRRRQTSSRQPHWALKITISLKIYSRKKITAHKKKEKKEK